MSRTYRCLTKAGIITLTEDELYVETTRIIWSVLNRKYEGYYPYHEDMAQEVTAIVFKAMERYDPDKGMAYSYIKTIACRRIYDAAKRINTQHRHEIALTDEMADVIPAINPPEERESLKAWYAELRKRLTKEEREALELKLDGLTNTAIYNALHPGGEYKARIGPTISIIWESIVAKALELGHPEE